MTQASQETKVADWSKLTKDLVNVDGFDSFWDFSKKRKGWSGVVTFARRGTTIRAQEGFANFDDEGMQSSQIDSKIGRCIMTDHGSFVLFNVYFPNAGRGDDRLEYKLNFYEAFQFECKKLLDQGRHVIVTGDVNTAHKEIDIWNPEGFKDATGFLPQERAWIDRFLADGYVDAYREFYPDKKGAYTFWDMRTMKRPSNDGWRIDYFLVSKQLRDRLQNCEILPDVCEASGSI